MENIAWFACDQHLTDLAGTVFFTICDWLMTKYYINFPMRTFTQLWGDYSPYHKGIVKGKFIFITLYGLKVRFYITKIAEDTYCYIVYVSEWYHFCRIPAIIRAYKDSQTQNEIYNKESPGFLNADLWLCLAWEHWTVMRPVYEMN